MFVRSGHGKFLDRIDRIYRIKKGAGKLNRIAGARQKVYHCPDCGAEIALRDINVKSDVMLCRACGRTSSCSSYLQREAARKVPGDPPKRVRVIHEEATFDRPREERIEWTYGLWGVLLGVFLMCAGGVVLWKFSLSIVDGWCTYFVGVGKVGQKREFKLRRDTSVEFEVVPAKNGSEQYWKQIRISNNDGADVVIGSLPLDVAEYFYQWLVYWAGKG